MNLALHGLLLQVFVSILNFHHGRLLCSAGEPGYLDFDNLPETNFSCQGKVIGGYYADVEAGCQMFHVCTIGQKDEIMDIKFLCLNGTVFDQETRVCERVDEVDCSKSERFYNLNLELYGNNAVTLSLHEDDDDEDDLPDLVEDHLPRTTSARPSTTSTTSTTTSRPSKPSTTAASGAYQHPSGYPQHYQPQPPFPQVHTSQSKSLYDDKNGGYHHQYIFHSGGERASNQATSYQLFSNQGGNQVVSSTTVQPPPQSPPVPPAPQIHQIRYSSTVGPPPQILHNEPSTVTPLYHATPSPTIQTLLSGNGNQGPTLINPIFHSHGVASTTEHFTVHSNNPRETPDYRDDDDDDGDDDDDDDGDDGDNEQNIRPLEAIQSTSKGKVSKLTISPVPSQHESTRTVVSKTSQTSQQQQRIPSNFLPTPASETTVRSFYPTPRPSPKPPQSSSQSVTHHVTQHIHVTSPGVTVPHLKPHQITINLPPPDIQRIVQNPSPLLPSQSRVIVTAKASVSDESGRPLNTSQLVTLPLPTIPASYDDYKEGDESFDPFYRDVPKLRKNRRVVARVMEKVRRRRSLRPPFLLVYETEIPNEDLKAARESRQSEDDAVSEEKARAEIDDFRAIKKHLLKYADILFGDEADKDSSHSATEGVKDNADDEEDGETFLAKPVKQTKDKNAIKIGSLEDLKMEASKRLSSIEEDENEDKDENEDEDEEEEGEKTSREDSFSNVEDSSGSSPKPEITVASTAAPSKKSDSWSDFLDVIILDSDINHQAKPAFANSDAAAPKTDDPAEIIIEEETKSDAHDATRTGEKIIHNGQVVGHLTKDRSGKRSSAAADNDEQLGASRETTKRKSGKDSRERKSGARRKGGRSRTSRKRISSRIKQQRTEYVEVNNSEANDRKDEPENVATITSTATITTTSTTTPSVAPFETKVAQQIDSHIFGEAESRTSKEVDTRAIGQRDSKSLRDSKDHDAGRSKETERSFDRQIAADQFARNSERGADEFEEEERTTRPTETTDYARGTVPEDTNFTENPASAEEADSMEVTHISEERSFSDERFSTEYESWEVSNDDGREESSEAAPNGTSSREEVVTSRESDREDSSYREDEGSSAGDPDEEARSTARYSEEAKSEESREYQDTRETTSAESAGVQEDYTESSSAEDPTTPADYATSEEEYTESREDVADSTEEAEDSSTEGVLKFTDELPGSDYKDDEETKEETKEETSESVETDAHDYIDDNYEPENYKDLETTTRSGDSKEERSEETDEENKSAVKEDGNKVKIEAHQIDGGVEAETQTARAEDVTEVADPEEVVDLKEVASLTTTSSTAATTPITTSTTMTSTTMTSTTMISTTTTSATSTTTSATTSTTTTSTTTPRPTITTSRTTPPKLFKPTGSRRIYAYSPPTTTPNPVVIKSRSSLLNPKPAKPLKSYNELAPKPMIRKLVLSRKPSTTTSTEKLSTESPETTTEPVTMTPSSTTQSATPTTTMIATEPMMTTTSTTESGKSEENVLESRLEAREPAAKSDRTNRDDQLPSPSEQNNTPDNSSADADQRALTKETETLTTYPAPKSSTPASSVEQTTGELEIRAQERIDAAATTVPSTLSVEKSRDHVESSTSGRREEAETTIASAEVSRRQDVTETTSIPSSEEPIQSTSSATVVQLADIDPATTTTAARMKPALAFARPGNRRPGFPRKHLSFNCLEKEMYRFYGDVRDCRLFHYCSPGFTTRQVLDFRFVCEEGTAFDEVTQSCRHDVRNRKCRNRSW